MSSLDYDIIVVGAGAVGLAFAAAMRNFGYRILILDSRSRPQFNETAYDLRVNTLNLASSTFLDVIGAWLPMSRKRVSPFNRIKVWSSAGGRIEFQAKEVDQPVLGHVVEASVMTTTLLEVIESCDDVDVRFNVPCQAMAQHDDNVQLQLMGGELLSCKLVVGADGGGSKVRELLGVEVLKFSYHQSALVTQVECSEPRRQVALQVFLPTGPLAFLPLADGTFSIVWSLEKSAASELLHLPEQEFEQRLAAAIDFELGDLQLMNQIQAFDLTKIEAMSYFMNRTVLVGDAAHIIHPLAGMGVNLGLMDSAALSEVLREDDGRGDPSIPSKLRKYQRWRKSSNVPIGFIMDGFDRGFRHPAKWVQAVLGMGMVLTHRARLPKREIIRLACGLTGDLPAAARRP